MSHFGVQSLDGFGLRGMSAAINAAGGLLSYLQDILCHSIGHIREIKIETDSDYMAIDAATWRHLDLIESRQEGQGYTLLSLIDRTKTAMGARMIRKWLKQPLLDTKKIAERQDAVAAFSSHEGLLEELGALLERVRDLERLMMKTASGYASPRDLVALKKSLEQLPQIKNSLAPLLSHSKLIEEEQQKWSRFPRSRI